MPIDKRIVAHDPYYYEWLLWVLASSNSFRKYNWFTPWLLASRILELLGETIAGASGLSGVVVWKLERSFSSWVLTLDGGRILQELLSYLRSRSLKIHTEEEGIKFLSSNLRVVCKTLVNRLTTIWTQSYCQKLHIIILNYRYSYGLLNLDDVHLTII